MQVPEMQLEGYPERSLSTGETLIVQGQVGGDLFVLEDGELIIERDWVEIARVSTPNAILGEMSVILDRTSTATVRAAKPSRVRVIADARSRLEQDQALTFRIAWLMANRLDATSAFLAELSRHSGTKPEGSWFRRMMAALHLQADDDAYVINRNDMFDTQGPARE